MVNGDGTVSFELPRVELGQGYDGDGDDDRRRSTPPIWRCRTWPAWLDFDVAQCGYCQPGQIMTAVAKVEHLHAAGRKITDADFDEIRDVCRCGTYFRVREAITAGAAEMHAAKPHADPTHKTHKAH